jgi:lipooligosaccharide transport system ATP-binding protein
MVVECRELSKRFGTRLAVDAVDLAVPAGVCYGVLGPNGAGKTTTLRMVYGAARPSAGTVRVFGLDVVARPREVRRRLGVTLQETVLVEPLDAIENLRVFGGYHLLGRAELRRRTEELLDFLDLREHARVPVRELSGGLRRRLAIALSLVNRPELLVLDEPTTGLDPAVRRALWERLRRLRGAGTTLLLTTHYMEEAERLCDRLAIMARGRVVAEGAPGSLVREHLAAEALDLDLGPEEEAAVLGRLNGVRHVRAGGRVTLYAGDAPALLARLREHPAGLPERDVVVRRTNLEDVFLALTGTRLEGGA